MTTPARTSGARQPGAPSSIIVTPAPVANAPSGDQPADLPLLHPYATEKRTIYMIGNAHLDAVWLWPWQEGYQEARATFWSAIHRMEEYEDFVFTCDQVAELAWVQEQDPELFARITERVDEGRWVNAGGWWVEPDCNSPMGESFARQGLIGQRFLIKHFGKPATVGMNVDPFGHNASIPAFLRAQGMDCYTFLRPGPHEEGALPDRPFIWRAPNGAEVTAYRIPHEYCSPPGEVAGQTDKALAQLDRSWGDLMVFYGVGNHGGGPTRANIESIRRYDRIGTYGHLRMASPREFFDRVAQRVTDENIDLPVWDQDLQHHAAGCYSAHSGIKAWQRRAQWAMLNAERWAIIGDILGSSSNPALEYPHGDLDRGWKQVLFNQFHDILPGSAIEPAYDDARDQLGEAVAISKRAVALAHNSITRRISIPLEASTQPVVVFNPHSWPVTTRIEIQYGVQPTGVHVVDETTGKVVPHQKAQSNATTNDRGRGACVFEVTLPPTGYRLYSLRPGPAPQGALWLDGGPQTLTATQTVLENPYLRVEVDPATGWLAALVDKTTGLDLLAGAQGPHVQICQDPTDTWGHHIVSYAWPGSEMRVERISLRESGPVRSRLRIERSWGRSSMVEELILAHGSRYLQVDVEIDWRERAHSMKLRFPLGLSDAQATYEIPWATIERPVDGAEEPAQSWVDLTGTIDGTPAGLTVINNAKHGYDVSPALGQTSASIGITAVRSAVYAWHDPRLLDEDGVYSYQDQGVQRFTYLLAPHHGDWRSVEPTRRAAEIGLRPRAMLESFHDGDLPASFSYAAVDTPGVVISALKGHEDAHEDGKRDLVIRLVETDGRGCTAQVDVAVLGRRFDIELGPFGFRTFRIPRDGGPVAELDLVEREIPFSGKITETTASSVPLNDEPVQRVDDGDASDERLSAHTQSPAMLQRASS